MKEKLVLVGNGMVGVRTLEELLSIAADKYDITVFGSEPYGNYNRIMLSPMLAGEKTIDEIMLNDRDWYADNGITLHTGKTVTRIDRNAKKIIAEDGSSADYNRLLLATGSDPFMLTVPGLQLEGVVAFRDIRDVDTMLTAAKKYKKAVVIGGGLLGLEAANGLMKQGMEVTVVHLLDTLMERQLDSVAARLLKTSLEERGLSFLMDAATEKLTGDSRVQIVHFKDGRQIETDLVVMSAGIVPNKTLALQSGLYCERGLVVNDVMQTFDPAIYAVGECVQHRGKVYGLVAPLFEQSKVAANQLAGLGYAHYAGSVTSTKLKVTGIDLLSAGEYIEKDGDEVISLLDEAAGTYKKIVVKNDRIKGAVLYGDTIDGTWYFQLMRERTNIADIRNTLLFGQHDLGDAGHGDETRVMSLPDQAEICGCNGVCKGDIVQAITTQGLFTLDEVRMNTKASSSCGSCTALVEALLASTVGEGYDVSPNKKAICGCTEYGHDDVVAAIKTYELKTIPVVREFLEWKSIDGCAICRPALNYYLLVKWPGEYQDDAQSRFINERAHGNIQKDGTYSVIPRIFGGETTAQQLIDLGTIADKWNVPTVKFTGGQRIDMLGIEKNQLPSIWADLSAAGFVSGHAYGKSLRTVKTCVGSEWCRFGTQDSTKLGKKLEHITWGSWMPHKFKLAVSGCPRNCAEATIKDFGVVCVESGYELHIGGNGGIKVRVTDLLCKVETEGEVVEFCCAFTQLYREEAHYLERTAPWVERVSLSYIKQRILHDDANREALCERFSYSQQFAQIDPWKERADGAFAHEFTPLEIAPVGTAPVRTPSIETTPL